MYRLTVAYIQCFTSVSGKCLTLCYKHVLKWTCTYFHSYICNIHVFLYINVAYKLENPVLPIEMRNISRLTLYVQLSLSIQNLWEDFQKPSLVFTKLDGIYVTICTTFLSPYKIKNALWWFASLLFSQFILWFQTTSSMLDYCHQNPHI